MDLPIINVYSNKELLLNRSYKFKRQNLIKENMTQLFDNKKKPNPRVEKTPLSADEVKWKKEEAKAKEAQVSASKESKQSQQKLVKDLSGIKMIGSCLMTENEIRKIKQNYLHDKLLTLSKKDLDSQLKYNLNKIRREKLILTEKFLDLQAHNYGYLKQKKNQPQYQSTSSIYSLEHRDPQSKVANIRQIQSAPPHNKKTRPVSSSSFDKFKQEQVELISRVSSAYEPDFNKLPDRLKLKTPTDYKSFLENLKDRFVEQKLSFLPSYVKKKTKSKISMTLQELDKILILKGSKFDSCRTKKICSKYKQHKLAQHSADVYITNKEIEKFYADSPEQLEKIKFNLIKA